MRGYLCKSNRCRRSVTAIASAAVATSAMSVKAHAANDVAGDLITFKQNGGWSWFQDDRVIFDNGKLIFGSVAGVTDGAATAGDVQISSYAVASGATSTFTLAAAFQRDDHDAPAITR